MSSIGLILKADNEVSALPTDWVPSPLGSRALVEHIVDTVMQTLPADVSALTVHVESVEESADPRTVSVSGVWGATEMKAIKSLCIALDARFYDAETGDFVEI